MEKETFIMLGIKMHNFMLLYHTLTSFTVASSLYVSPVNRQILQIMDMPSCGQLFSKWQTNEYPHTPEF